MPAERLECDSVSPASDLRRNLHDEGRAFPYDALGPNSSPHHFREPLRQSETEIHLPITKNGQPFDLPIVDIHHEILEPMRSLSREWVFPAPKSRSGHLECPKRIEWSPHAHRRTFATVAMEAGILEEIVGRLLNHTPLSITGQRYARPSLDALRPAMQVVCDAFEKR